MPRQILYKPPHPQVEDWLQEAASASLSDERARDVYLGACARIAAAIAAAGFKYIKSKQQCYREHCGFVNTIRFQSSHFNVSGRHVQLWMHATVSSRVLQSWRAERLPAKLVSDHVAGGMVHLLGSKFALIQWELADPATRDATIADAVSFIDCEVLPYFGLFEDPLALTFRLSRNAVPAFELRSSVEFALCYAGKQKAQLVLDRALRERADLRDAVAEEESRTPGAGSTYPGTYAQEVVFLRRQYGLA